MPELTEPAVVMAADVLRIAIIIGCGVLLGATGAIVIRPVSRHMSRYMRARFACLVFAAVSVAGTELERLHDVVTWRLPVNAAFLALALWGVWGIRSGKDRAQQQMDRDADYWLGRFVLCEPCRAGVHGAACQPDPWCDCPKELLPGAA
jgi:hypothetical protein